MKKISTREDLKNALRKDKSVIVFSKADCLHCTIVKNGIESIEEQYPLVQFYFTKDLGHAKEYNITEFPVMMFIENGSEQGRMVGSKYILKIKDILNLWFKKDKSLKNIIINKNLKQMKKFLMFLMAAVLLFGACKDKEKQQMIDVEATVKADHEYMSNNYDCEYVWYEAEMVLGDYIDAEDFDGSVASITNVFQTIHHDSVMDKSKVVMIEHHGELMVVKEIQGLWIEDVVMKPEDLKLTYKQAWDKLMATDCVKPHSKYVVLRNPLGPKPCNPQYIFGNAHGELLFVDGVTGDVSNENPAFGPKE